jgi:hypothetical protein
MGENMKKILKSDLIAVLSIGLISASVPASATKTRTLKNAWLAVTIPTQIKLPKKGCASVKGTCNWGLKAKNYDFGTPKSSISGIAIVAVMQGEDGSAVGDFTVDYSEPWSGAFKSKYCVNDWMDEYGA